jgi:hypothetical protein
MGTKDHLKKYQGIDLNNRLKFDFWLGGSGFNAFLALDDG